MRPRVMFYEGDIVEIMNLDVSTKIQFHQNGFYIGNRHRVNSVSTYFRIPFVSCSIGSSSYDHSLKFDQIMLYKRPLINWIRHAYNSIIKPKS